MYPLAEEAPLMRMGFINTLNQWRLYHAKISYIIKVQKHFF